jgi:hypothetical protein
MINDFGFDQVAIKFGESPFYNIVLSDKSYPRFDLVAVK